PVGRPCVRAALRAIREAFTAVATLPAAPAAPNPGTLPYKWARLLETGDLRPDGPGPRILAAGTLEAKRPLPRTGVAVADAREVAIATQPDQRVGIGTLGVDLVSLPRRRLRRLVAEGDSLEALVETGRGAVRVRMPAHRTLASAAAAAIGPFLAGV
ncbi:MAG: hypothetical protein ACYDAN_16345, partial [Candidatus Limnocylindrales bacterium]